MRIIFLAREKSTSSVPSQLPELSLISTLTPLRVMEASIEALPIWETRIETASLIFSSSMRRLATGPLSTKPSKPDRTSLISRMNLLSSTSPMELSTRSNVRPTPRTLSKTAPRVLTSSADVPTISAISERGSRRFSPTLAKNMILACSASSALRLASFACSNKKALLTADDTMLLICSQIFPLSSSGFMRR